MTNSHTPGLVAGRLDAEEIASNFADLHPAYDPHEAAVAADRCYFCHDAPCVTACPTDIDIPLFIRQIATAQPEAAAQTIFEQNILGGMCARVCPTETLCEEACVREAAEGKPVEIGRLQRFATDSAMARQGHPFLRAASTGKSIGVVGSGPAGLACAHRLAMKGHDVTIYEARDRAGGLNEYGLAAYKTTGNFAAREIDWLLGIGGITVVNGQVLGDNIDLATLQADHDAVFLGIGLGGVNLLDLPGFDLAGVRNAVDFIAELRQAEDKGTLAVGRNIVVIGGGMTAIDAAVQSRLLGAQSVTLAYRRDRAAMGASGFEQDLAATHGVRLMTNVTPVAVHGDGAVQEIELEYTQAGNGTLHATGERIRLPADQVLLAIGQTLAEDAGLATERGKLAVSGAGRTSLANVWAGGDCTPGEDLTVVAVAEGRDAAEDIHAALSE
ncbi:NAD(P)-dependent oxidoreductase [Microbulbifer sp. S227A]|uniref:NAD(P)-dependent oxidoreductase n=1 Tax=Microbulbifer sp. S227A TaxID=3415131 RepID=UPI003C7E0860